VILETLVAFYTVYTIFADFTVTFAFFACFGDCISPKFITTTWNTVISLQKESITA
jgi:hypothetical protein